MIRFSKEKLRDEMNRRKVKVPALEKATGIPRDRIYAWYRDNTNPKREDQDILERWLNGLPVVKNEEMDVPQQLGTDVLKPGDAEITLNDYINEIKEHNSFLKALLLDKTNKIETNLARALEYMTSLHLRGEAARGVALRSLSRLEKKPEQYLISEVDKEIEAGFYEQQKQDIAAGKRK